MIKSALFFSICIFSLSIFYIPQSFAYTDAELTAKYHDLQSIQTALDSGELKCTDLPDNIKSATCTDTIHKPDLPNGETAPAPISANMVYSVMIIPIVVVVGIFLVKFWMAFRSSHYERHADRKQNKNQVSPLHSLLLKVGLAHHVKKIAEDNPISSDLTTIEDHIDSDSNKFDEALKKHGVIGLSPMQEILMSLGSVQTVGHNSTCFRSGHGLK
jgi:hypothetical protein